MPPSTLSSTDPATAAKIQQLLQDPVAGPKLMAILNGQQTGVMGGLGNAASAISKQQTPSGQIGAGIGAGLGMGLQQLLKKKAPGAQNGGPGGGNVMGGESMQRAQAGPPDEAAGDLNIPTDDELPGFAHGGAARPKKKSKPPEKKRAGGSIKPRKAAAVPPSHGPGYAKGGQVRGRGIAQRGTQFRGIY